MSARDLKRTDIRKYAAGAIEELSRQLNQSKTDARKVKIQERIVKWKQVLESK